MGIWTPLCTVTISKEKILSKSNFKWIWILSCLALTEEVLFNKILTVDYIYFKI